MSTSLPYPYVVKNSDLIKHHNLEKHFEGGYFSQTIALSSHKPAKPTWPDNLAKSPELQQKGREQAPWGPNCALIGAPTSEPKLEEDKALDATLIYYLLTAESYRSKMHMNLHSHFHLHHAGRALYTLIKPPSKEGEQPEVKRIMLGPNVLEGEVTQLFVPGGWWKASEIPEEDLTMIDHHEGEGSKEDLKERIGCLISEVVVPGWTPDQHMFIDEQRLKDMWGGKEGWEPYTKYLESR